MRNSRLDDTELETIRAYDVIAPDYSVKNHARFIDHHIAQFVAHLRNQKSVIDLGCGTGQAYLLLAEELGFENYVGIDASANMVASARKEHPEGTFTAVNFYDLPDSFPENSFDAFFAFNTLMHVSPAKMTDALRAIRKVLQTGAIGFVRVPAGEGIYTIDKVDQIELGHKATTFLWCPTALTKHFESSDFSIENVESCNDCGAMAILARAL